MGFLKFNPTMHNSIQKKIFINKLKVLVFSAGMLLFGFKMFAQDPTIGLLKASADIEESLTLFSPEKNTEVYLVNNCGQKINEWSFSENPGATCYILENGNLLRAGKDSLEIRNWQNDLIWSYAMNDNGYLQHHDIEPLPNGNILCVLTDTYTQAEIIEAGRDPINIDAEFKLDKIIELEPVGTNEANLVWEWKFMDHFIQDFDSSKSNYGLVADHPELIDINFNPSNNFDWSHVNAIDYSPILDQILISPRNLSEIYIIDHSTTTAEAAGHTGGNFNKGGDILFRWGNPQVYRQGSTSDQKLVLQHDAKWVESGYLDEGKISVFNNGGDGTETFSSVHLIEPEISNSEYLMANNTFLPQDYDWSWNGSFFDVTIYENKKSGAHSLPNGNFVICETSKGQISEINKNGDHLWSYKNPTGTVLYNQFDIISGTDNSMFRGEKYPVDYPGFSGQDLTPGDIIEDVNQISEDCINGLSTDEYQSDLFHIANPVVNNSLIINNPELITHIQITDFTGKIYISKSISTKTPLNIMLKSGLYLIKISTDMHSHTKKIIVL